MFYRDTQALVIHISRGTRVRGDIVIHISLALARHTPQRGLNKLLYELPRNPACRITSFFLCF